MKNYFFILYLILFISRPLISQEQKTIIPLKINVISSLNGKGLEADQKILAEALEQLGCSVKKINFEELQKNQADINIFFEKLVSEKFSWAKINWFIPNPEWYTQDIKLLNKINLILCKTHESQKIFQKLNKPTYYLGFTSLDCLQSDIKKNYSHFFHLAGESLQKGTPLVQNIWLRCHELPLLTVVKYPSDFIPKQSNLEWISCRLKVDKLRLFQNQCGVHLCPSTVEGFGHYIMEAMSTGAVVITTNAPPMNEFIQDSRCLVSYLTATTCQLGTCYYIDPIHLEDRIRAINCLPVTELEAIGTHNRKIYLKKTQEFYEKLKELVWLFSNSLK